MLTYRHITKQEVANANHKHTNGNRLNERCRKNV